MQLWSTFWNTSTDQQHRYPFFRDVELPHWLMPGVSKEKVVVSLQGSKFPKKKWVFLLEKMRIQGCPETSGTKLPETRLHIPKQRSPNIWFGRKGKMTWEMRTALFWIITQRVVVRNYWQYFRRKWSGLCILYEDQQIFNVPINQPTRCNNFPSLLLDVYVPLNMFRASLRPSSGAQHLQ